MFLSRSGVKKNCQRVLMVCQANNLEMTSTASVGNQEASWCVKLTWVNGESLQTGIVLALDLEAFFFDKMLSWSQFEQALDF